MKLVAQSGPLTGQELPVDKPVIVLGREAGCDIPLQDPEASRHHAEIRFAGGQVSVADSGSMNGTFVNGIRIQGARPLRPGDEIRIGVTRFVLQEGMALAPGAAVDTGDLGAGAPPVIQRSGMPVWLILGGVAVLVILLIAGVVGFLVLRGRSAATVLPRGATNTPIAAQGAFTPTPPTSSASTPSGPTATPAVETFVTFTPAPAPTAAAPTAGGGGAPRTPQAGAQAPPFRVTWSPGRYEGWAEGRRMSSDLTIQNVSLPQISPPYAPYFIISDASGAMRVGELHDYSSAGNPLPTLPPGTSVTWTWFTAMSNKEWVRGSVFRYAGYAWAQEFNPDGSLNGAPRVIDEKSLIPFLPKQVPPEMLATIAAGGVPTGVPAGVPTGVPPGAPTVKP